RSRIVDAAELPRRHERCEVHCGLEVRGEIFSGAALTTHHLTDCEAVVLTRFGYHGVELTSGRLLVRYRIRDREGTLERAETCRQIHERRLRHKFEHPGESRITARDRAGPFAPQFD